MSELSHRAPSEVDTFCDQLVHSMVEAGAQAEAMRLPLSFDSTGIVRDMLTRRTLDVWNVDRLISLRFPAHLIRHQNKVLWALDTVYPAREAARLAASEAVRVYCPSRHSAEVLFEATGYRGSILLTPVVRPELFCGGESLGHVFASARIASGGAATRLLAAMRFAPSVRLILAGMADSSEDASAVRGEIETLGIADRVQLIVGQLDIAERARFINQSLAVAYLPDDDSLGLGALEAFQAAKPVVTTSDSKVGLELVRHRVNGIVSDPNPSRLGAALLMLDSQARQAARMGALGRRMVARRPSWEHVVQRLLS